MEALITFQAGTGTSEEQEQQIRFRTYLKYVRAFCELLNGPGYPQRLIKEIAGGQGFKEIAGGRCRDLKRVGELLRNAWFTELQMNLPEGLPVRPTTVDLI